jgi:hypothetical protein
MIEVKYLMINMDRTIRIQFGILFISLLLFSLCTNNPQTNANDQKGVPCGGWDTYGDVVCGCDGKLEKPSCPANASCDSGSSTCYGKCGICTCFQGRADLEREITCGGRDTYAGKKNTKNE